MSLRQAIQYEFLEGVTKAISDSNGFTLAMASTYKNV